jgi:hypothetical protein
MVSKTRMLSPVQTFNWNEVKAALAENPQLLNFRDKKGRNWLHLCCSVNIPRETQSFERSLCSSQRRCEGPKCYQNGITSGCTCRRPTFLEFCRYWPPQVSRFIALALA